MSAAGYELRGVYGTEPYWPEKKLKICVTGAGGFIASHLAKRLKEEGPLRRRMRLEEERAHAGTSPHRSRLLRASKSRRSPARFFHHR